MKSLGNVKINGQIKQVSVQKDGETYKYFLDNECIGAYNPKVMGDDLIVFRENTIENELSSQIRDSVVQVIEKAGKENIIADREEREHTKDNKIKESKSVEKEEKEEKQGEKNKEINKAKTIAKKEQVQNSTKDINIKQEIKMDTMVTDMDSLGERLEKAGKIKGNDKHAKVGIVESDQMDNLRDEKGNKLHGHSSRYQAVVLTNQTAKDGGQVVKPLDIENDTQEGTNPNEKIYQVDQNGTTKKGDVVTRLKIQGEETIGIEKGQYGEVKVYHSHNKTIGGEGGEPNKSLDKQIETSNSKNVLKGNDQATMKLSQEYQDGYRSVEQSYQEAKKHEKNNGEPCEELEVEDIDGDLNTSSSHNHIDETVKKLMENGEIKDKFTEREVKEMVEKAYKNNTDSLEDFQEKIENEIEADAERMKGERQI